MHLCKHIEQRYHCKDNNLPKRFLHSFKCACFTCSLLHFSHVLTFEEFSLKTDLVLITEPDIKLVVIGAAVNNRCAIYCIRLLCINGMEYLSKIGIFLVLN